MSKEFNLTKDKKNGNFKMSYSYEMDDEALQQRKSHLEKSIQVYEYQITGLTESKDLVQKELDAINSLVN